MQSVTEARAIRAMGRELGPDVLRAVQSLYRQEQERLAAGRPPSAADLAYGPDPRQRLDLYAPAGPAGVSCPVVLWVHGGGFLRGDKGGPGEPFNAHAGRWAARHGMVGAVMNYRLAPDHRWPAGAQDVAAAVEWLRVHAAAHGGDPARILLVGTSAGATHIAACLGGDADLTGVRGAVLLSALYGATPPSDRDLLYYGDAADYPARRPFDRAVESDLPLLVVAAELDPPRFQAELTGFLAARLARHGHLPRTAILSDHNHVSLAYHLGGGDTRLADEILAFVRDPD